MSNKDRGRDNANWVFGGILIAVGVLWLLAQLVGIRVGSYLWPLFIIVPGVVLFVLAMTMEGRAGEGLAITGGIVTMVGLLLFYQNATGHWQSWAYAWALVAPTSIGLAQIIYGLVKGLDSVVASGRRIATVGIIIFLGGAAFFELVIGISGFGLGGIGWAVLLIGAGVLFLLRAILTGRSRE
ncbi:MAG: hypothetical protein A2Y73_04215 [Chloroflexi bacterium RBG_13_56_8]|nr:MAG: hypothetical protein A2Y73_04215 [Chloroflexi bacterium RBG_13_56_8]